MLPPAASASRPHRKLLPGGCQLEPMVPPPKPPFSSSVVITTDELNGGFGGGTIGSNWQPPGSNFLWGLEADAAGGSIGTSGVAGSDKINAFGSVTGRHGITSGPALFYVKG